MCIGVICLCTESVGIVYCVLVLICVCNFETEN